jgi:hypothetical protein
MSPTFRQFKVRTSCYKAIHLYQRYNILKIPSILIIILYYRRNIFRKNHSVLKKKVKLKVIYIEIKTIILKTCLYN